MYYLGIDTGGTFTDGVLFDPIKNKVVKTIKVLTTHANLSECIASVLDGLIPDDPSMIGLVSLSTTLITNAIAEGKRKPVALLLLGYDKDLITKFGFQSQFGTQQYFFVEGKHDLNGVELAPLNEDEIIKITETVQSSVDSFAVVSYAGPRNSCHEERASEIISSLANQPVVQSHHLSSELDSIRRATTASLNASLLSYGQSFLNSIQSLLTERGLKSPIMVVRGDGSIVKTDFARKRPVEIIHSGPATSAIGGYFLAQVESGLVIDIGGTTTDIALVHKGKVEIFEHSATVGPYRTAVKTIKTRSFGLGGDSLIRFDQSNQISIGPEKVIPFSRLASSYPQLKKEIIDWLDKVNCIHYYDRYEYWLLRHEPTRPFKNQRIQKIIELLREGPQPLKKLLKITGTVSPIQLHMDELLNQEIIDRAALTPTDLLHVTGEYTPWDSEIASRLIDAISKTTLETPHQFIQKVRDAMTDRISGEVVQYLSQKTLSDNSLSYKQKGLDRWFYEQNLTQTDLFLGCKLYLKIPLIGIGAPAKAFLTDVARVFGTEIIIPEHYDVANAVGTVVGQVVIRQTAEVFPKVEGTSIMGYLSRVGSHQVYFEEFDPALAYTRKRLTQDIADEAKKAGTETPEIVVEENEVIQRNLVHLSAWAIGKPAL